MKQGEIWQIALDPAVRFTALIGSAEPEIIRQVQEAIISVIGAV